MKYTIDTHTHTLACGHAYSTILENAKQAAGRGLTHLAITDHAPGMEDSPHIRHFLNYVVLDKVLFGVEMLYGAELDILDYRGSVSMENRMRRRLDLCIASFHPDMLAPGSQAENTRAYLCAMQQYGVSIIGHPEDGRVPVDYEALAREAKKTNTLLELNNTSLKKANFRKDARENAKTLLSYCERYGVRIALGSDAHWAGDIGDLDMVSDLLEELSFPPELVINRDPEALKRYLESRK